MVICCQKQVCEIGGDAFEWMEFSLSQWRGLEDKGAPNAARGILIMVSAVNIMQAMIKLCQSTQTSVVLIGMRLT